MTAADFAAPFDEFSHTAFRFEGRQTYAIPSEDQWLHAHRHGLPRPERSLRTDPWLKRIALTTATEGKTWSRGRLVKRPWTEYTELEILAYIESQAVGEEIWLVDEDAHPEFGDLGPDFWLFDGGTPEACAVLMRYDEGVLTERELVTCPDSLVELDVRRRLLEDRGVRLNAYLAGSDCGR